MTQPTELDYIAAGWTGLALNMAILGRLKAKGLLSKQEISEMVDLATLVLEQGGLPDDVQKKAYGLLQGILSVVETEQLPQK